MSRKYLWDLVTGCEEGREEKDVIMSVDIIKNCGVIEGKRRYSGPETGLRRRNYKFTFAHEEFEVAVSFRDTY